MRAACCCLGAPRGAVSEDAFRAELREAVAKFSRTKPLNEEVWDAFAQNIHFVATPYVGVMFVGLEPSEDRELEAA